MKSISCKSAYRQPGRRLRGGTWSVLLGSALLTSSCVLDLDSSSNAVNAWGVDNPELAKRCGVDLVLVLDASASVRDYNNPPDGNGAVDLVAGAARAFLAGFANTNSRIAVVSYNANPLTQLELTDVTTESIAAGGAHDLAIGDPGGALGPVPVTTGYSEHARRGSGTNWEAGLANALALLPAARPDVPRVVVHVTDGRPTRHLDPDGKVSDIGSTQTHVDEAAEVADQLKLQGVHIYSVGIGRATSGYTANLQAVSGPDVFDQAIPGEVFDPAGDDVILASDFDQLKELLGGIAGGLCGASLTITKLVSTDEAPDTYLPSGGWSFTARPEASSGFAWVLPDNESSIEKVSITDEAGRVQFQWEVSNETAWGTGSVLVAELQQRGYELQAEVTCSRTNGEVAGEVFTIQADTETNSLVVPVGPGDAVACEVRNRICEEQCHGEPIVSVRPLVELWPPNHRYHTVSLADCVESITDACGNPIDVIGGAAEIVGIYSDESENDTGDGNTTDDIQILDSTTFQVRAERRGMRDGRVYGVVFAVTDEWGNSTTAVCLAGVPHDQSGDPPVDSYPGEGYEIP